jgi:hypothetical protein
VSGHIVPGAHGRGGVKDMHMTVPARSDVLDGRSRRFSHG